MINAGYEDAVAQYLTGRESTFAVARILSALRQASNAVNGLFYPVYNIASVLSGAAFLVDFSASMPLDTETFDTRGTIYTFVTGTPATAYEIKIQATAELMATIFSKAINGEYSASVHSSTEINPYFAASAASGIVTLSALKNGRFPNNYELTDWDGILLSPSTPGAGNIPLLMSFTLDLFGAFLFTGGGVDIQGQGKSASRRYELAIKAIEPYLDGTSRLLDEDDQSVAFRSKSSYATHDPEKDYVNKMADKKVAFYEELKLRKAVD